MFLPHISVARGSLGVLNPVLDGVGGPQGKTLDLPSGHIRAQLVPYPGQVFYMEKGPEGGADVWGRQVRSLGKPGKPLLSRWHLI